MAGHSKWSNIKRKKAAVDAKRSKVWTKVIREIQIASRLGGPDPDGNPRLRLAIDKARGVNVPKDSIQRAVDKGSGNTQGQDWQDVTYEAYGPGGAALLLECTTDNRNRTVGEIRHALSKHGGNMAKDGAVSWMFHKRGLIYLLKEAISEEKLMALALEAGAEDIRDEGEVWCIETDPGVYWAVKQALERANLPLESAEIDNIPETRVSLEGQEAQTMLKLVDWLEDLDDVGNVYSNCDLDDDEYGED